MEVGGLHLMRLDLSRIEEGAVGWNLSLMGGVPGRNLM
jgi:hypothetical protein